MATSYSINRNLPECRSKLDGTRLEIPLPAPRRWTPSRPGEIEGHQPEGDLLGSPAPDAGYVLLLFERLAKRLRILNGENLDDVRAAITATALTRASRAGRAPCMNDLEWAAEYWGMLDQGEDSMTTPLGGIAQERRAKIFAGCADDFTLLRRIANLVLEDGSAS